MHSFEEPGRQRIVALNELAGMLPLQALCLDALAVHEDVEDAIALAAPVRRAQDQRLAAHLGIEFEVAAGPCVAARPEAVRDRIRDGAREAASPLVVLEA